MGTSPLWVLLLGGLTTLTHNTVLSARILGTLFEILAVTSLVWLGSSFRQGAAVGVVAALLLCTNSLFLLSSFGGMEISLYLFTTILATGLLFRGHYAWGVAVAALSVGSVLTV